MEIMADLTAPLQDEEDDELDSSVLAAFGCLRAITTVLESMSSMTQLYPQLEEILFPLMFKMCSSEGQEVFEEIVEIISYFTYFSPTISPKLWLLWPRLHEVRIAIGAVPTAAPAPAVC
jgi:hypothetical protein